MPQTRISRRGFVGGALAASALPALAGQRSTFSDGQSPGKYQLYWGDLHNHNAVGYGQGSLERSIELARGHLDFFAFTGHASWHDMPKMPGDRHMKWVRGFDVHGEHWNKTRGLIRDATDDRFLAILGYEWHSSQFGDYCMLFPRDQPELFLPDHVEKLLDFAQVKHALAVPHHLAYLQGWRGANWNHYRDVVSPVVEIFSEHGCSERDTGPGPMIRHSMGGRWTANTVTRQLQRGLRFGFVASSDDHRGYPGAYGEGIVALWAEDLSGEAMFEALRARRSYAATGDRIALEVALNGQPMGSELPPTDQRQIDIRVEGQDAIAVIELLRNGRVIRRHFPEDHLPESEPRGIEQDDRAPRDAPRAASELLPGRVKCRVQFGWGPWAALDLGRVCHWDLELTITGGRFLKAWPCYQAAPFDEQLRDRLEFVSDTQLRLQSATTRQSCFAEDPTKAVVCEIDAQQDAELVVRLRRPSQQLVRTPLARLIDDNAITFTGGFTSESFILHRLVGPSECSATLRWNDPRDAAQADWYHVRVTQQNGHMAWSSPIWVG